MKPGPKNTPTMVLIVRNETSPEKYPNNGPIIWNKIISPEHSLPFIYFILLVKFKVHLTCLLDIIDRKL